jgi:hypothetical protein
MQPTGFLCSLPDYKPTKAALSAYKKINEVTQATYMIANFLGSGTTLGLIAGRSSTISILPSGAVKFFESGQIAENITSYDFALLTQSFAALSILQKNLVYQAALKTLKDKTISSDDKKILRCIYDSVR